MSEEEVDCAEKKKRTPLWMWGKIQTLGEFYTFLIILRSRMCFGSDFYVTSDSKTQD